MKSEMSVGKAVLGLGTGAAFGALLHKGRLDERDVIVGQLTLEDWRVVKTMGSAVVVGAVAIHALARMGLVKKDVKPLNVGGVVAGAAVFGIGMALTGYCPGTSVAAVGAGKKDAASGVLGMLFGASLFVASYPKLLPFIKSGGQLGKKTVTDLLRPKESAIEVHSGKDSIRSAKVAISQLA